MRAARPTSVAGRCKGYADVGADQLTFGMLSTHHADRDRGRGDRDVRHVRLPEFDTDPVHRTTRQREAQTAELDRRKPAADGLGPLIV